MKTYLGTDLNLQREKLLKSEAVKPVINEIISVADEAVNYQCPVLTYSDFMIFKETGSRIEYEQKYFTRRKNCSYMLMAYYITHDEKYLKPLCDLIFAICDEFAWCLPAHAWLDEDNMSPDRITEVIDLFQAETARLMCDCYAVLEDVLPEMICRRIKNEVRRRVIVPMRKNKYWWFKAENNWATVCAGGVSVPVLIFGTEEEKEEIFKVLDGCVKNYIDGFTDDGCCSEGYVYWNYGFGYFMIYAQVINEYTCGKRNYYSHEKIKKIALFPQKVRMGKSGVVRFSDAKKDFFFSPGTMSRLKEIYPEEFECPDMSLFKFGTTFPSVKEVLWLNADYKRDKNDGFTAYFEDAQWIIKNYKSYSFAAKGGNNDEHHNHNDVGSFMITTGENTSPLADLGSARYTRDYFVAEKRYNYLNCSSKGHSVPIINDTYQCFGKEFKAENVLVTDNEFTLDIEGAYESGIIDKITRSFAFLENRIILTDKFVPNNKTKSITERFVSEVKPNVLSGAVELEDVKILFDEEKYTVNVTSESYLPHNRSLNENDTVDVYIVDFKAKDKTESRFEFEFEISVK